MVELASGQHRVVSAAQLASAGFGADDVHYRVRNALLHPVFHGVYALGTPQVDRWGRWMAAVLACGEGAALSHRSAAALRGLRPGGERPEVTVPRSREGIDGIRICRSRLPLEIVVVDGIPVTTVARTLLDLAAVVPFHHLRKAVDEAERQDVFDLFSVLAVLEQARGRKGARALRRAIAAWDPKRSKSELERRFAKVIERSHLPRPERNVFVRGEQTDREVDFHWPAARLAVQVDGWQYHRTRRDKENDAASDADLELAGERVMRLTWDDATIRAEGSIRRIEAALTSGWAGNLGVIPRNPAHPGWVGAQARAE